MRRTLQWISAVAVLLFVIPAGADELRGVVLDGWTDEPLPDVEVFLEATETSVRTDGNGGFFIDVPSGFDEWSVVLTHEAGAEITSQRYVRLHSDWPNVLRVYAADGEMTERTQWGAPIANRPTDGVPSRPVSLEDWLMSGPNFATVPSELPATIRVGRRFAGSCSGNPVQRIDEVPFEEYVQGVLVPEIGVFKAIMGGPDSAEHVYRAFAVAARSYALWWYLQDPGADYHLDDTACNQRYEDARDTFIGDLVAETAGQILVRSSDGVTIDKFEYAASCGRNGTRPEYQTEIVPDQTGTEACVRSWCGHNDCAAHEDHPDVPGSDRCLVRGICQWGAAERSMNGQEYVDILAHYEPNLTIRTFGVTPTPTELVGFVRIGQIDNGAPVGGVTVDLDTGESTTTGTDGYFAFPDVQPGERTVSVTGGGVVPTSRTVTAEEGTTTWASVAVELAEGDSGGMADAGDTGMPDAGHVGTPDATEDGGSEDVPDARDDAEPDVDTEDDATSNSDATPDPDTAEDVTEEVPPSPGGPIPAYSLVSDLQVEDGCGCRAAPSRSGFGWIGLVAIGLLVRRGRRNA